MTIASIKIAQEPLGVKNDYTIFRVQGLDYVMGCINQQPRDTEVIFVRVTSPVLFALAVRGMLQRLILFAVDQIIFTDLDLDLNHLLAGVHDDIGSIELVNGDPLPLESEIVQQP